jgi:sucrose-phosphate synthase
MALFCPQGNLLQANAPGKETPLYIARQGETAENGGQVIYVLEMARALAEQGYDVDIYARNYGTEDYADKTEDGLALAKKISSVCSAAIYNLMPIVSDKGLLGRFLTSFFGSFANSLNETVVETMPGQPGVRILHIPTAAHPKTEKEHFYPYYGDFMANAASHIRENDYEAFIGHYADGNFMAALAEEMKFREDGKRRALLGTTHSLGDQKKESLIKRVEKEVGNQVREGKIAAGDFSLKFREGFNKVANQFNIHCRRAVEDAANRCMDGMIPVSLEHKRMLSEQYGFPEDQQRIIPGGVNQNVFRRLEGKREDLRAAVIQDHIGAIGEHRRQLLQDGKIVFGFGRMVVEKGIINVVKAMKTVLENNPDAVYVYAGGNIPPKTDEEVRVYNESMDFAREHGYEDRIIFLGSQSQHTINKWANIADNYPHAAFSEPWGLAIMEAAITGVPVVMSKEAGARDVLKHEEHAIHINPLDPDDIAAGINRVLDDPDQARAMAQRCVKTIIATNTWGARAADVIDFAREAGEKYLPARQVAKKVELSPDAETGIARDLLFRKLKLLPTADEKEVRQIMNQMLSTGSSHRLANPAPASALLNRDAEMSFS